MESNGWRNLVTQEVDAEIGRLTWLNKIWQRHSQGLIVWLC